MHEINPAATFEKLTAARRTGFRLLKFLEFSELESVSNFALRLIH